MAGKQHDRREPERTPRNPDRPKTSRRKTEPRGSADVMQPCRQHGQAIQRPRLLKATTRRLRDASTSRAAPRRIGLRGLLSDARDQRRSVKPFNNITYSPKDFDPRLSDLAPSSPSPWTRLESSRAMIRVTASTKSGSRRRRRGCGPHRHGHDLAVGLWIGLGPSGLLVAAASGVAVEPTLEARTEISVAGQREGLQAVKARARRSSSRRRRSRRRGT